MPLHHDLLNASKLAQPKILKMARQQRLVDECFKEFQRLVFPGCPPDQVAALRVAFFAGAAELNACLLFGCDPGLNPTDDDMTFLTNINEEIDRFHRRTIEAMGADTSKPQ